MADCVPQILKWFCTMRKFHKRIHDKHFCQFMHRTNEVCHRYVPMNEWGQSHVITSDIQVKRVLMITSAIGTHLMGIPHYQSVLQALLLGGHDRISCHFISIAQVPAQQWLSSTTHISFQFNTQSAQPLMPILLTLEQSLLYNNNQTAAL